MRSIEFTNPRLQSGEYLPDASVQRRGVPAFAGMARVLFIAFLMVSPTIVKAQSPLDDYVRLGLENNLALKQKETSYQKSLEALKEAKGLFFPNITLNARFSVAEGGRTIDLPIGDLLNPVYVTLNQILRENRFPQVDNQSFLFLRPEEQETKIRMIQPVFNTDIYYNSKIKRELTATEMVTVHQYRQELVAEIRKSYYNVAMADGIVNMLNETRKLLEENIRVNQKLVDNGKITIDNLFRAQTEMSKFDQKVQVAAKNKEIASAYLNFLLNRSLTEPITLSEPDILPVLVAESDTWRESALTNREELKKINSFDKITALQVQMNQAGALPNVMIVADYGIQGEKYKINKDADFAQASAILTWNLFAGFQNRAKIRQAKLQKEMLDQQSEEVRKQIELQVINALNELKSAQAGIESATSQVKSAREGFRLVKRRYQEGQANLIEFIDARTTLTQAEENVIISRYTYLADYAEFEKVCAINKI
ncbi:MAG: TolC family protein [Porphyromonadaceae bacterium]|nr:MAG: TolC family protein [Porphyromonadaceae bacterium]